jgi:hypothetical protein
VWDLYDVLWQFNCINTWCDVNGLRLQAVKVIFEVCKLHDYVWWKINDKCRPCLPTLALGKECANISLLLRDSKGGKAKLVPPTKRISVSVAILFKGTKHSRLLFVQTLCSTWYIIIFCSICSATYALDEVCSKFPNIWAIQMHYFHWNILWS